MLHDSPVSSPSFPPSHPPYLSLFFSVQHPGLKILRSDSSSSISSRIGWTSLFSVVWKLSFFFVSAGLSFTFLLLSSDLALLLRIAVCIDHMGDSKVTSRSLILRAHACAGVRARVWRQSTMLLVSHCLLCLSVTVALECFCSRGI